MSALWGKNKIQEILKVTQAPVVQKVDSAVHRINHYPADNTKDFVNTYRLDSVDSAIHLLNRGLIESDVGLSFTFVPTSNTVKALLVPLFALPSATSSPQQPPFTKPFSNEILSKPL